MGRRKDRRRGMLVGALAALGTLFACLDTVSPQFPGGIYAGLSTASWLGAVSLAARRW